MAENKKSFLLYCDIIHTVKKLTDEQAGKLFKHILSYVNDEDPTTDDILLDLVFEPIKQSLKRDLKRYESICNRNQINGAKGGRPIKKPKKPTGLKNNPNNPEEPKKPDSDIDSDIEIIDKSITTWRKDFNAYISECNNGYKTFNEDVELIKTQQRLNPGLNIPLTIEKGYRNFWGTEAGWKNKKATKTENIDWKRTIINSIDSKMNRVYLSKNELAL
jgi:hypothetical protein